MSKRNSAIMITGALAGGYAAWRTLRRKRIERRNRNVRRGQHIVILGAGFGGIYAARRLARLLPGEDDARITLVDQRNYLLFTPMLPEVASGELDPLDIVRPPRDISPRVEFLQATVEAVDLKAKSITVQIGNEPRTLLADYVVIALGSVTNFHHVPGVEEHALTMKSLEDAQLLRNRVVETMERANAEADPGRRKALLTFVVGGGGFTGVETIAAINSFLRDAAPRYPGIRKNEIQTHVVEPGPRLLPELDESLAQYARQELEARGVEVHTGTKLTAAGGDFVELDPQRRIAARTLVWAGGVKPAPVVEKMDCRRGHHGGIVVDQCCAVVGRTGVWAIGDCAEVPEPGGHGSYAPTAQNATREGEHVAENIAALMRGESQRPFLHRTIGEMALVGKHAGVAKIYGAHFSGIPAWALWRLVYLSKMPGWRQRTRILADWILDFAFGRATAAIPPLGADAKIERRPPVPMQEQQA